MDPAQGPETANVQDPANTSSNMDDDNTNQSSPKKTMASVVAGDKKAEPERNLTERSPTDPVHSEGNLYRAYKLTKPPPMGWKKFFRSEFKSCTASYLTMHRSQGYFQMILNLAFSSSMCSTFQEDWSRAEKLEFTIGKGKISYLAVDKTNLDTEGNYIPRITKLITIDNLSPAIIDHKQDIILEQLEKFMTFEKDVKFNKVYEDGVFCGTVTLSVKDYSDQVPHGIQIEIPMVYRDATGEFVADKSDTYSVRISCQGFKRGDGGVNFVEAKKYCNWCHKSGHKIEDCIELKNRNIKMREQNEKRKKFRNSRNSSKKCKQCGMKGDCTPDNCVNEKEIAKGNFPVPKKPVKTKEKPSRDDGEVWMKVGESKKDIHPNLTIRRRSNQKKSSSGKTVGFTQEGPVQRDQRQLDEADLMLGYQPAAAFATKNSFTALAQQAAFEKEKNNWMESMHNIIDGGDDHGVDEEFHTIDKPSSSGSIDFEIQKGFNARPSLINSGGE